MMSEVLKSMACEEEDEEGSVSYVPLSSALIFRRLFLLDDV